MTRPPFSFEKVIDVMYRAGKNLKPYFGSAKAIRYKTGNPADSVTDLDIKTEEFILKELHSLDPTIGFKGEELGVEGNSDRLWLVDPIDGTEFFRRGVWGCTTMLALIEEGEITLSAIYDFVSNSMYYAQKGKGAFSNKHQMGVSKRGLKDAFLYIEMNLNNEENLSKYLALDKICLPLRGYPSGIHFALAASGKVEGRIGLDPWGKDYDFAPGQLLVQEAGGVVRNIGKDTFDYRNLNYLAVNREVYRDLTTGKNPIFPIR